MSTGIAPQGNSIRSLSSSPSMTLIVFVAEFVTQSSFRVGWMATPEAPPPASMRLTTVMVARRTA